MIIKILVAVLGFFLFAFQANALTCERYRLDTSGFQTKAAIGQRFFTAFKPDEVG